MQKERIFCLRSCIQIGRIDSVLSILSGLSGSQLPDAGPSLMSQQPSKELHTDFLPNSNEVWALAYQKYLRFWTNLAKTTNVTDDEAKDIVHGVISTILTGCTKQFQSYDHIRNYVAKSIINRAIQLRQRNERKTSWSEIIELQFPVDPADPSDEEALRMQGYRQAIAHLSDRDFEIIKLRFYSGYTFQEISQMLNSPISTLKSREEAALRKIRRWLRKKGL